VVLGEEVGYRIGQEGMSAGKKTHILFVTAGWLLQL
jgi:HrpA-like RNA helicase